MGRHHLWEGLGGSRGRQYPWGDWRAAGFHGRDQEQVGSVGGIRENQVDRRGPWWGHCWGLRGFGRIRRVHWGPHGTLGEPRAICIPVPPTPPANLPSYLSHHQNLLPWLLAMVNADKTSTQTGLWGWRFGGWSVLAGQWRVMQEAWGLKIAQCPAGCGRGEEKCSPRARAEWLRR